MHPRGRRSRISAHLFWAKVDRRGPDECWPWLGGRNEHGYGLYGKVRYAHRASYVLAHGVELPRGTRGLVVLHTCDERACVNPAHLELGTMAENMRQRSERGPRGYAGRPKKLTRNKVRQIRELIHQGKTEREVAGRFGVSQVLVHHVKHRKLWAHVP